MKFSLRRITLPPLAYTIDRPFRWSWFSYVALVFALVVLGFLIPMNYALQGYQVITQYERDPNTTSNLWFDRFTGRPEPGSLCDDHIFEVGDSFRTNPGLFLYTLQEITHSETDPLASFGSTTIPYKGQSLDWCDAISVGLQIGPQPGVANINARIRCIHPDFQINMTTTYAVTNAFGQADGNVPPLYSPLWYLIATANDLFQQNVTSSSINGTGQLVEIPMTWLTSALVNSFCPMAVVNNPTAAMSIGNLAEPSYDCTPETLTTPPIDAKSIIFPIIANFDAYDQQNSQSIQNVLGNIFEVMVAVVRFDLGNHLPNNFLFNTTGVLRANETFAPANLNLSLFADTEHYDSWLDHSIALGKQTGSLPYTIPNKFYPMLGQTLAIGTSYACHLTVPKSVGSAVISIIVATLSIGSTIWGLFIFTATYFAKRTPESNYCEYHSLEAGALQSLPVRVGDSDIEMSQPMKPTSATTSRAELPLLYRA